MRDQPVTPPIPKRPESISFRPPRHHPLPSLTVSAPRHVAPDTALLPIPAPTVNKDKRQLSLCTPENTTTLYSARLSRLQKMRVLRDLVVCQRQMAGFNVVGPQQTVNLLKASASRKTNPRSRQEPTKSHDNKPRTSTSTQSLDHRPCLSSDPGLQQMVTKYSGPVQEYATQPNSILLRNPMQHRSLHDRRLAVEKLASSARSGRETCVNLALSTFGINENSRFCIAFGPTSLPTSIYPPSVQIPGSYKKAYVFQHHHHKKSPMDIIPSTSSILQEIVTEQDIPSSGPNDTASSSQPSCPSASKLTTNDSWNLWTPKGPRNSQQDPLFTRAPGLVHPSVSDIKYAGASTVPSILKGSQFVWNTALVKDHVEPAG